MFTQGPELILKAKPALYLTPFLEVAFAKEVTAALANFTDYEAWHSEDSRFVAAKQSSR